MDLLYELLDDINSRIRNGRDYAYGWDGKIEYLEEIIEIVPNPYSRQQLHDRYVRILA